jgi:hypothetical protein
MKRLQSALLVLTVAASQWAGAADDRFAKDGPGSMNGVLMVSDAGYQKECGACHIAYSPGLLPAASWELVMGQLEKHFGESVALPPATKSTILRYLADNAMDKSPYAGSQVLFEKLQPGSVPHRIMLMPWLAYRHAVIREGMAKNGKIQVKRLSNCGECHRGAKDGSYALGELLIPGLTPGVR